MTGAMRSFFFAALSLWCMLCICASPQPDRAQFQPLVTSFLDSWNKHDPHAFAQIFASDAVVTTVGGTRIQGPQDLEKYMQPSFTGPVFKDSVYSASIKFSRLLGPDVAVLD